MRCQVKYQFSFRDLMTKSISLIERNKRCIRPALRGYDVCARHGTMILKYFLRGESISLLSLQFRIDDYAIEDILRRYANQRTR